tara:strand:+ start:245 stop:604 length:360 start_codon:yes stop_codon:yes gene_type:complete
MGIRDKVRTYFEPETDLLEDVVTEEGESPEDQAKFLALANEITSEIFAELNSEDEEIHEVEEILVSEYDVGDVELEQLNDDELVNYSELNVVQHDTYDEIVEYLADAKIIGDLPEEVEF